MLLLKNCMDCMNCMKPLRFSVISIFVTVTLEIVERVVMEERAVGTIDAQVEPRPGAVGSSGSGFTSTTTSTSRGRTMVFDAAPS